MLARKGQVVTNVLRWPVRPVTRWMHMVSMGSVRVIAGSDAYDPSYLLGISAVPSLSPLAARLTTTDSSPE
jgi:hypothetical protein